MAVSIKMFVDKLNEWRNKLVAASDMHYFFRHAYLLSLTGIGHNHFCLIRPLYAVYLVCLASHCCRQSLLSKQFYSLGAFLWFLQTCLPLVDFRVCRCLTRQNHGLAIPHPDRRALSKLG